MLITTLFTLYLLSGFCLTASMFYGSTQASFPLLAGRDWKQDTAMSLGLGLISVPLGPFGALLLWCLFPKTGFGIPGIPYWKGREAERAHLVMEEYNRESIYFKKTLEEAQDWIERLDSGRS